MRCNSTGFTLVEIAIVLIVVGLLAGGVLKGQQLIDNVRYKAWVQDIDSYRIAVQQFQERYKFLPGDYPYASTRLPQMPGVTPRNGNANGVVEWACPDNATMSLNSCEPTAVLQHLMLAGFYPGDPLEPVVCRGTPIGGMQCTLATGVWGNGIYGFKIIYYNIPVKYAKRLDSEFDDADAQKGDVACHTAGGAAACNGSSEWPADTQITNIAIML